MRYPGTPSIGYELSYVLSSSSVSKHLPELKYLSMTWQKMAPDFQQFIKDYVYSARLSDSFRSLKVVGLGVQGSWRHWRKIVDAQGEGVVPWVEMSEQGGLHARFSYDWECMEDIRAASSGVNERFLE